MREGDLSLTYFSRNGRTEYNRDFDFDFASAAETKIELMIKKVQRKYRSVVQQIGSSGNFQDYGWF